MVAVESKVSVEELFTVTFGFVLSGISDHAITLKVGAAGEPVNGPAKNNLGSCEFKLKLSVPELVTGLPDTVKILGELKPTLVTVPDPTPAGKSAVTNARKVGVAALPVVGPAKTRLADCVASVTANVPVVVIGLPAIAKMLGTVMATLVTVPVPTPAGKSANTNALKLGEAAPPLAGPANTVFAFFVPKSKSIFPDVVIGLLVTVNIPTGLVVSPTLVTEPEPDVCG